MSEALVIIGNGMAAARLVEELSEKALGRYAIAVIGEEPTLAYNRVMLSSVLAGDIDKGDLDLKPAKWWRDYGVTLRCGCKASAIDLAQRVVNLADGNDVPYRKLVIATGSHALRELVAWRFLKTYLAVGSASIMPFEQILHARIRSSG